MEIIYIDIFDPGILSVFDGCKKGLADLHLQPSKATKRRVSVHDIFLPECPYGLCRCYDPNRHEDTKDFYQAQFRPWAIAALIVYGVGFPLLVFVLIMVNKSDIKTDQFLHAHKIGNSRELSTKSVWSTRVKYKQLYYYFKPGKVYWILWIIYRKLAISIVAVLFYSNPGFQLAFTILILFSSYVLQVRNRPYMSPMERNAERNLFNRKVDEGSANHVRIKKLIEEKLSLSKRMAQQAGQNTRGRCQEADFSCTCEAKGE